MEILKALYRGVEILILDEPTAVLTPNETKDLFGNLSQLREAGRTIVFISHKLDEVLEIADRITVLRRGQGGGGDHAGGDDQGQARGDDGRPPGPVPAREADGPRSASRCSASGGSDGGGQAGRASSLEVRAGEILGVAGVEGNGQRELAETLIGLRAPTSGTIEVRGQPHRRPLGGDIRNAGVAYIPEDRHDQGLVLSMSLWENSVLGRQDDAEFSGSLGFLLIRKIKELAARLVKTFDIRARSVDVTASTLSGGNQQKLILARELETDPQLLVAAQPTRGLDVGAIEFVWKQILEQKAAGRAVLLISAELDEIYALSDRIVTLYEGKITGEFAPDAPPEQIGIGMLGGASADARAVAPQGA